MSLAAVAARLCSRCDAPLPLGCVCPDCLALDVARAEEGGETKGEETGRAEAPGLIREWAKRASLLGGMRPDVAAWFERCAADLEAGL